MSETFLRALAEPARIEGMRLALLADLLDMYATAQLVSDVCDRALGIRRE